MFQSIARNKALVWIVAYLSFATFAESVAAQARAAADVTAQQVEKAIRNAQRYLRDQQLPDGGWPVVNTYPGGASCLVTLALLNSGLPPEDPTVARALNYIESLELKKTYTVSLQTMALCAANPNRYAPLIERNAKWLLEAQQPSGGWDYERQRTGSRDPSNSQFALLALHEAQRAGVQLPPEEWRKAFTEAGNYWKAIQNSDGSFPYTEGGEGRGSMTCAGIASLVIVGDQLGEIDASVNVEVECCGNAESDSRARIEAALRWLGRNYAITRNPGPKTNYLFYYLYALERTGRLTGQRFIGDHDWYREGCEQLLMHADDITGRIVPHPSGPGNDYTETAFALLFLSKGKRQIVASRLQFGSDGDWNHHAASLQHLTAFTELAWKRDLAWQTIDVRKAAVGDLLESPVLILSGRAAPVFSEREKQILKEYVEQGGFIYAEAAEGRGCSAAEFERGFASLVVELFDQPLEKLPPSHPIWSAETKITPAEMPEGAWLYGVQTCCRLGVVYCNKSLGCRWELDVPYGSKPNYAEPIQRELDNAVRVGVNLLAYATGRELKEKLDMVTVLEDVTQETSTDRGLFVLPVLRHNAGADDAPRAVPNLVQWLDKENPFQMSSEKRLISAREQELGKYPVIFVHGRGTIAFTEQQREALRAYLENGFLFGDAICADEEFARSFRDEIQLITGSPLENLDASHPMFSDRYYGFDLKQVEVVNPDNSGSVAGEGSQGIAANRQRIAPRLQVVRQNGRICAVFSPLDMSCALESKHSLQCRGYVRDDAARLGINIILFALQQE